MACALIVAGKIEKHLRKFLQVGGRGFDRDPIFIFDSNAKAVELGARQLGRIWHRVRLTLPLTGEPRAGQDAQGSMTMQPLINHFRKTKA